MATGSLLIRAGPGCRIIPGDGHHFIMAGGIWMKDTGLYGFLMMNGVRDGLPGDDRKVFTGGRPSDRV